MGTYIRGLLVLHRPTTISLRQCSLEYVSWAFLTCRRACYSGPSVWYSKNQVSGPKFTARSLFPFPPFHLSHQPHLSSQVWISNVQLPLLGHEGCLCSSHGILDGIGKICLSEICEDNQVDDGRIKDDRSLASTEVISMSGACQVRECLYRDLKSVLYFIWHLPNVIPWFGFLKAWYVSRKVNPKV